MKKILGIVALAAIVVSATNGQVAVSATISASLRSFQQLQSLPKPKITDKGQNWGSMPTPDGARWS